MWKRLNNSQLIRYLLLFAFGWVLIQVIAYFETVLVIFVFAAIVAFLLNHPVIWISRFMPRWLAVVIVFFLALLVLGVLTATLGLTVISQIQQILEQAPQLLDSAIALVKDLPFLPNNIAFDFNAFEAQFRQQALSLVSTGLTTIQNLLLSLLDLVLIIVVAFFMLLDGKPLWNFVLRIFPQHLRSELTVAIAKNFLGFFWGRLLLSIFFGASAFLVFVLLGIPYALAMAANRWCVRSHSWYWCDFRHRLNLFDYITPRNFTQSQSIGWLHLTSASRGKFVDAQNYAGFN